MESRDRLRIALLAAFAISLHGIERMIPAPVPWLRFGFANIITLTALVFYGIRVAMMITLIRVFIVSLLSGTFPGPGFILSLGGGIISTLSMGLACRFLSPLFSPLGFSLIGAFSHNLIQVLLAYMLFVRRLEAVLYITPLILVLGIMTGAVNGISSGMLISSLRSSLPLLYGKGQGSPGA